MDIDLFNTEKQAAHKRRLQLEKMAQDSNVLSLLDTELGKLLTSGWKHQAEELTQVKQEDINIVFNMLEISSQITQPIVKLAITVKIFCYTYRYLFR